MTPDEIQAMARGVAEASGGSMHWIGYWMAAVVGGAVSFLGSYLAEKGKGRATKEDVAKITHLVEEVKLEYIKQVEDLKAHHQMRVVAAEKRLHAHQQAFLLWRELQEAMANATTADFIKSIEACQRWYDENCVFLAPASREAFGTMWMAAIDVRGAVGKGGSARSAKAIESMGKVVAAGNTFLSDVDLPPMNGHHSLRQNLMV